MHVPRFKRKGHDSRLTNEPPTKEFIKYWIEKDPLASWRSVIVALDAMGEKKVADAVRHLAEPLTGSTVYVGIAMGLVFSPYIGEIQFLLSVSSTFDFK